MIKSAHCTITILVKKAVWHVNSTIFLCSYVWDGQEHNIQIRWWKNGTIICPLDFWKHSPIVGHNCLPGRWLVCHPKTLECPAMTMAGSHFQPRWQNMRRTQPELESYLWRKHKQGDSIIQLNFMQLAVEKMACRLCCEVSETLTNLTVGYANEPLVHKFVRPGVSGLTLHDVTLGSFIGQWNGRNLEDKRTIMFMQEHDRPTNQMDNY